MQDLQSSIVGAKSSSHDSVVAAANLLGRLDQESVGGSARVLREATELNPDGRLLGADMHKDILAALPHLRAFAHLLARDHAMAEDLVQDTIVRALTYQHQFQPGTNLRGWLTIILRNRYFNEIRRRGRKAELHVELEWGAGSISGGQEENLEVRDFKRAFASLPAAQREALLLVGASGVSYEEAAKITGCAVGTIKSRVSRARLQLQQLLDNPVSPRRRASEDQRGVDEASANSTPDEAFAALAAEPEEITA